jgi:hypothetical protein
MGVLSVKKFHIAEKKKALENGRAKYFSQELKLNEDIKKKIVENIISNTDVRIEIREGSY